MTNAEALRVIAMLTAYFRQEMADETAVLWAKEISQYELQDGLEAAEVLGSSGRFMPPLSEFLEATDDCRRARKAKMALRAADDVDRWPAETCTLEEFLRDRPDMRARLKKTGWFAKTIAEIEKTA